MAARLVDAELALALFNALRTASAPDLSGIQRGHHGDVEFLLDPTRPASPYYNRAVGRLPDSWTEAAFSALPTGVAGIEIAPQQLSAEVASRLAAMNFRSAHALCYLGMEPRAAYGTGVGTGTGAQRLDASQTDTFFDLLELQGVAFPQAKRALKRGHYCTEQFQVFMTRQADGQPTAGATMFVNDGIGYLGNVFTLPAFRGQGCHAALLSARLQAAAALHLEMVFTDVAFGSQSHHNCERAGFGVITVNTVWTR